MSALRSISFLVIFIALLGAGIWFVLHEAESPTSESFAPLGDEESPRSSVAAPALESLAVPSSIEKDDASERWKAMWSGPGVLRGRVLGLEGKPASEAVVQLVPGSSPKDSDDFQLAMLEAILRASRRKTRTDAEGRFEFTDLKAAAYWLDAHDDTYCPSERTKIVVDEDQPLEDVELRLVAGHALNGVVREQTGGGGVAGVLIVLDAESPLEDPLDERRVTTDAEGRFRIVGIRDGTEHDLEIKADGYTAASELPSRLTIRADRTVDVFLTRLAMLAGYVRDPFGELVAGALVAIVNGDEIESDEEGRFRFELAGRLEEPFELLGATEDLDLIGRLEVALGPGERREDVELHLARSTRIVGRVTTRDGTPIRGAEVTVRRSKGPPDPAMMRQLESLGYIAESEPPREPAELRTAVRQKLLLQRESEQVQLLEVLQAARHSALQARQLTLKEALRARTQEMIQRRDASTTEHSELELARAQERLAAVQQAVDQALAEAKLKSEQLTSRLFRDERRVETDEEGRYAVLGLRPGRYACSASAKPYLTANAPAIDLTPAGDEQTQDFALRRGATLSGRVFESSGELSTGATLWLMRESEEQRAQVAENGEYRFDEVYGGQYRLFASSDLGGVVSGIDLELAPAVDHPDRDIFLIESSQIRGHVDSITGEALAGVELKLTAYDEASRRFREATDDSGEYVFDNLWAGTYQLEVSSFNVPGSEQKYLAQQKTLTLGPQEERRVHWELEPAATFAGQVLHNGRPSDQRVYVMVMYGTSNRAAIADLATGSFRIDSLPSGKCRVFARTLDYAFMARMDLEIRPGQSYSDVLVPLEPARTVTGRAMDRAGRPLVGVTIVAEVEPDGQGKRSATTGADGRFEIGRLYSDQYRIEIAGDPDSRQSFDARQSPRSLDLRATR